MSSPGTAKRKHGIFEVMRQPRFRLGRGRHALVLRGAAGPGSLESLFHGRSAGQGTPPPLDCRIPPAPRVTQ
jgi:hypothetical protein